MTTTTLTPVAAATAAAPARTHATPVSWPLRLWIIAEIGFGLAALSAVFLRPQDSATNFAWPIRPTVMAATLGAFYVSAAVLFVTVVFARRWQTMRVMVIPSAAFSTAMLLATFLHWDKFSLETVPFVVWFASYILPPPIFIAAFWWHQKRSLPVGENAAQPLPAAVRILLGVNGLMITGLAVVLFAVPSLLQQVAPWQFTPLTVRTLCGWLVGVSLIQVFMAWEADWPRVRLASLSLIVLPVALLAQLLRFGAEVQWSNLALWGLLADLGLVALLLLGTWVSPPRRLEAVPR